MAGPRRKSQYLVNLTVLVAMACASPCFERNTTKEISMRKLIYAINVTLDGCCDHTKMVPDEELFDHFIQLIRDVNLFVYGRKTYQLMVPYWPDIAKNPSASEADIEFAQAFDSKNKIVFSRSLDSVE